MSKHFHSKSESRIEVKDTTKSESSSSDSSPHSATLSKIPPKGSISCVEPKYLSERLEIFLENLISLGSPSSKAWKKSTTKNSVEIYTYNGEGNQTGIMGILEVPYDNRVVMEVLKDPHIPFEANPFHDEIKILEQNEDLTVLYMKFKGMLMVSGRDFDLCNVSTHINEGKLYRFLYII